MMTIYNTTVLERVALAIWYVPPKGGRPLWTFEMDPEYDRCMNQAKAAIVALMNPTKAMIEAGYEASKDSMGNMSQSSGFTPYLISYCWKAMLNEALK